MAQAGKTRGPMDYSKSFAFAFAGARAETQEFAPSDDTLLVRQAQQGDTAAFEQLIRHYDQAVLRFALHLTGSAKDARNIYQAALLHAYKNLRSFRFECSFYVWIFRIVANHCLEFLCANQPSNQYRDERTVPDGLRHQNDDADSWAHTALGEQGQRISRALAKLSPRERMVFELKHYHGLRLITVADLLNTTEDTIKNTLFRAVHKLGAELSD